MKSPRWLSDRPVIAGGSVIIAGQESTKFGSSTRYCVKRVAATAASLCREAIEYSAAARVAAERRTATMARSGADFGRAMEGLGGSAAGADAALAVLGEVFGYPAFRG